MRILTFLYFPVSPESWVLLVPNPTDHQGATTQISRGGSERASSRNGVWEKGLTPVIDTATSLGRLVLFAGEVTVSNENFDY